MCAGMTWVTPDRRSGRDHALGRGAALGRQGVAVVCWDQDRRVRHTLRTLVENGEGAGAVACCIGDREVD